MGPISFGASGGGGKIKLSCVSLAELTSFTHPHPWRQEGQGHTGSSATRGHHQELEACLACGNPLGYNCSQGLLAWLVNSHSLTAVPPTPAAPTQLCSSSSKPQLGTSQGGLSFIKLNFPRSGQRPGSREAAGWKPGLEGRREGRLWS